MTGARDRTRKVSHNARLSEMREGRRIAVLAVEDGDWRIESPSRGGQTAGAKS
jgi:hypothetical protein